MCAMVGKGDRKFKLRWWGVTALAISVVCSACGQETGTLTPEAEARLAQEGILHRADKLVFRYTHGYGTRESGWEERVASIIVTRRTVYIHKNERVGLEINPRTRRFCEVERRRDRVRVRAGSGQSAQVWSFVPPGDAEGWTRDIRAVIRGTAGAKGAPASGAP
jgi:hypothetical protein